MTARRFNKKYRDTVKGGYSKTKIINRAIKWGLRDKTSLIYEYLGGYLSIKQCQGFTNGG